MTTQTVEKPNLEWQSHRLNKCMVDIFEWLKYVRIKNETTNELISWQSWPHLKLLLTSIMHYKLVRLGKSRQLGCSWAAAAYHLWLCYRRYTNVLCLSRGEKEAAELLDKSRFINLNLPDWLKLRISHDGSEYMNFSDSKSRIMALPSTKDAGIGYTATHVTGDEKDFHPYAEENDGNVLPTINAGGSKLDMSSPSSDASSYFKTQLKKDFAGETNYHPLFFPYYMRPSQDAEWYIRTAKDYWPVWKFRKAHPRNLTDFFGSVEGEGLFDAQAIDRCLADLHGKQPIEARANGTYIFRRPDPHIKYYAGGDGAEGRGGNNSVIFILGTDGFDKELVAILRSNQMTPDLFSFHAHQLLCEYGRPMLVMGADPWSQMILDNLVALKYRDKIYCSKKDKLGLMEDEANKQKRLMDFAVEVRNGLRIRDKQTIDEMSGWVLQTSKETQRSKYVSTFPTDDCIIAGANALFCREISPKSTAIPVDRYF